jgi:hypothetical protein
MKFPRMPLSYRISGLIEGNSGDIASSPSLMPPKLSIILLDLCLVKGPGEYIKLMSFRCWTFWNPWFLGGSFESAWKVGKGLGPLSWKNGSFSLSRLLEVSIYRPVFLELGCFVRILRAGSLGWLPEWLDPALCKFNKLNLLKEGTSMMLDPFDCSLLILRTICLLPVGEGTETKSNAIRSMSRPSVFAMLSNSASLSAAI